MTSTTTYIYALLAGIIPGFLWLWFWLREDRLHPEPRLLILISFLGGMAAVPLVLPFEQFVHEHLTDDRQILFLWALIEESFKFIAAYILVLRRKADDEPLDPLIYMITVAIGFAALENSFFILKALNETNTLQTIATTDLRFIGATLLHIVSSAIIGASLALTFFKSKTRRFFSVIGGLFVATLAHALFNYSLLTGGNGDALKVFMFVWGGIILLMLIFEEVKLITPENSTLLTVQGEEV